MGRKSLTKEQFVTKATAVHGDKFDYSLVVYTDNQTKIPIICPVHGEFKQVPNSHLQGSGCRKCSNAKRSSKDEDIRVRISEVHKDNIVLVEPFKNNLHEKLMFQCKQNHSWLATTNTILHGSGCPECSFINRRKDTSQFIKDAILVHGDKYDYSKVVYTTVSEKVTIICNEHGQFKQTANAHLVGTGCPKCAKTGFKTNRPAVLYILGINGNYKFTGFGISNNYQKRKRVHNVNLKPHNCTIQSEIFINSEGDVIQKLEQHIKQTLQCNNSHIDGFKTESVLISPIELKDFAVSYLDKMGYNYKLVV